MDGSVVCVFLQTAIGGALSRDQKLSDHIHWKWAFSLNMSTAKSFASAFQVNIMENAPNQHDVKQ